MDQEIDLYTETCPAKDFKAENLQSQRAPGEHRVPPEEENPRMKCRNCGAFGHTARSKRCPIKSWDGAMAPLPLGVLKKEKENQDPGKPQNHKSPEPVNETEGEKRERERLEEWRKALVLKFPKKPQERKKPQSWKDTAYPGVYLRRPSRPSLLYMNKKSSLNCTQPNMPSVKKSDGEHVCYTSPSTEDPNIILPHEEDKCQALEVPNMLQTAFGHSDENPTFYENPTEQSTEYCFHQALQAAFKEQEMDHMLNTQSPTQHSDEDKHSNLHPTAHTDSQHAEVSLKRNPKIPTLITKNPLKKRWLSSYQRPQKSTKKPTLGAFCVVPCSITSQVDPKGLPQVTSVEQQPPHNGALQNFTQPLTESQHPLSSSAPVQPLRMVFTRLRNDYWSSRISEAPPSHPPENKVPSVKISPSVKQSEKPQHWVPLKIIIKTLPPSSS
ncbi:hypothetical protein STEG23_002960 [Scotinomys teguina]